MLLSYAPAKRSWIFLACLQGGTSFKSLSASSVHIANRRGAFPEELPLELPSACNYTIWLYHSSNHACINITHAARISPSKPANEGIATPKLHAFGRVPTIHSQPRGCYLNAGVVQEVSQAEVLVHLGFKELFRLFRCCRGSSKDSCKPRTSEEIGFSMHHIAPAYLHIISSNVTCNYISHAHFRGTRWVSCSLEALVTIKLARAMYSKDLPNSM